MNQNKNNIKKLLVVALKPEWSFLKQDLTFTQDTKHKELFFINHKKTQALLQVGLGLKQANKVFSKFILDYNCESVLHFGSSGALTKDLQPGDLNLATSIWFENSKISILNNINKKIIESFSEINEGSLLSVKKALIHTAQKQEAHNKYKTNSVDMESYAIAKLCEENNIAYTSIRSIFDGLKDDIEELGTPFDKKGNFKSLEFMGNLVTNPKLITKLPNLIKRQQKMNQNLKKIILWFLD